MGDDGDCSFGAQAADDRTVYIGGVPPQVVSDESVRHHRRNSRHSDDFSRVVGLSFLVLLQIKTCRSRRDV